MTTIEMRLADAIRQQNENIRRSHEELRAQRELLLAALKMVQERIKGSFRTDERFDSTELNMIGAVLHRCQQDGEKGVDGRCLSPWWKRAWSAMAYWPYAWIARLCPLWWYASRPVPKDGLRERFWVWINAGSWYHRERWHGRV